MNLATDSPPGETTSIQTVPCLSFNYAKKDGTCEMNMLATSGSPLSVTTDDTGYDYYELGSGWVTQQPSFINSASGSVSKITGGTTTLYLNFTNLGKVVAFRGQVTFAGGGKFGATADIMISKGAVLEINGGSYDLSSGFNASFSTGK